MIYRLIDRIVEFCCCLARKQTHIESARELARQEYDELLEYYRQVKKKQNKINFNCCT